MPVSEANQWWTVKDFARFYGLSERSIYDFIAAGELIAHRFGKRRRAIRISDSDRLEWERQCRTRSKTSQHCDKD